MSPHRAATSLSTPQRAALLDVACTQLMRHGHYYVTPEGTKHKAATIGSLAARAQVRVVNLCPHHDVARITAYGRSIALVLMANEADVMVRRELRV